MNIELKKFGTLLTSRQSGREAYSAFTPTLSEQKETEEIVVDFTGVTTFSPSWGDEFLRPLHERYGKRLFLRSTENPSVKLSLEILEETNSLSFQKR
jgi:hypothetical protein